MRRLILFRHAKAERPDHYDHDRERDLTEGGIAAARGMGEWLEGQGIVPDLVLCSPALRTRQTWDAAAKAFEPAPEVLYEDGLYDATAEEVLEVVRNSEGDVQTLLVVGHNPSMESLALMLAESAEPEVAERFEKKFPTGAIAVLDFEDMPWAAIEEKQAWLYTFETPKHLGLND